jgi:hypothetical protein
MTYEQAKKKDQEIWIIGSGEIDKETAEHIVKIQNEYVS